MRNRPRSHDDGPGPGRCPGADGVRGPDDPADLPRGQEHSHGQELLRPERARRARHRLLDRPRRPDGRGARLGRCIDRPRGPAHAAHRIRGREARRGVRRRDHAGPVRRHEHRERGRRRRRGPRTFRAHRRPRQRCRHGRHRQCRGDHRRAVPSGARGRPVRHLPRGARRGGQGDDPGRLRTHHQHRLDVRPGRQHGRRFDALPRREGRRRQPHAGPRRRVGRARHHSERDLPRLLLHRSHHRDTRQRFLPAARRGHDPGAALRAGRRARHGGAHPGLPGLLLRHRRGGAGRRRLPRALPGRPARPSGRVPGRCASATTA